MPCRDWRICILYGWSLFSSQILRNVIMWVKVTTRNELYEALDKFKKDNHLEYVPGEEFFFGAGWYWITNHLFYFGRGATDHVAIALTAEKRIQEIKEKIKEQTDLLVESRKITKS